MLGTVSGYATSPGNPAPERLELATIYLRYAASAIERERLLTEVSRRNRVLESLRGLLESLAGPERLQGGLEISLLALLDGLGADTAAVMAADGEPPGCRCVAGETGPGVMPGLAAAASAVLSAGDDVPARLVQPGLAAGSLRLPGQRGALVARWHPGKTVHLTPTEFALLRQFAVSPGELLTHATLLRRVWGPGYETQTEYTRVYVGRLRAKLERAGDEPLFITEPRSGYRFATA